MRVDRGGYLVASALIVVMIAMFLSTATLARLRAKTGESGWSERRTQEIAAARSATAQLVAGFNRAGELEAGTGSLAGEVGEYRYTAELRPDPDLPNVFHLTARVGQSTFTRVLHQEPRRNVVAYARAIRSGEVYLVREALDGPWRELPPPPADSLPPLPPGWETGVADDGPGVGAVNAFGSAANQEGDYFLGRQSTSGPQLLRYQSDTQGWDILEDIPWPAIRAAEQARGRAVIGGQSPLSFAANEGSVFLVLNSYDAGPAPPGSSGPPNPGQGTPPPGPLPPGPPPTQPPPIVPPFPGVPGDGLVWRFDLQSRSWAEIEQPRVDLFTADGGTRPVADVVSVRQVTAGPGRLLAEVTLDSRVSTLVVHDGEAWSRLPPIPRLAMGPDGLTPVSGYGRAVSMAAGPGNSVVVTTAATTGESLLLRLTDGAWSPTVLPAERELPDVFLDAEDREWLFYPRDQRLRRFVGQGWADVSLPEGLVQEPEVAAKPDERTFYYHTTASY